jgi:hypothetical protein
MKNLLDDAGSRGLALLLRDLSGVLGFVIQSRGIAHQDEESVKTRTWTSTINVSCEIGIVYCPFCGKDLEALIAEAPQYFRKLADAHQKFIK